MVTKILNLLFDSGKKEIKRVFFLPLVYGAVNGALQREETKRGGRVTRSVRRHLPVDKPRGDLGDVRGVSGPQDTRCAPASRLVPHSMLRHVHSNHSAQEGSKTLSSGLG